MTPQEIKQQAHKEFAKYLDHWDKMQEIGIYRFDNKLIDSLIDRTAQMTEERIAQKIKGAITLYPTFYDGISFMIPSGWSNKLEKYIISLITNKSEINK